MSKRSIENNRYIFLIASHINDINRVEALRRALASIVLTNPDHVYLSYSVDESYNHQAVDFTSIWSKELENIVFTILYQPERKYQFEHFNILKDYVQDDDIVSFSNDTDLTDKSKVDVLKKHFADKRINVVFHAMNLFVNFTIDPMLEDNIENKGFGFDCREYIRNSIRGWLFKEWFNNYEKYAFEENHTFEQDIKKYGGIFHITFSCSLKEKFINQTIEIDDILYHRRMSNIKRHHLF